mmetsp:Transcript_57830/g.67490  ORF Transcript_57830/g.67490 Transcript_57830/m.67490 type:complete len:225 (+) Transcript_57830:207-881(+)
MQNCRTCSHSFQANTINIFGHPFCRVVLFIFLLHQFGRKFTSYRNDTFSPQNLGHIFHLDRFFRFIFQILHLAHTLLPFILPTNHHERNLPFQSVRQFEFQLAILQRTEFRRYIRIPQPFGHRHGVFHHVLPDTRHQNVHVGPFDRSTLLLTDPGFHQRKHPFNPDAHPHAGGLFAGFLEHTHEVIVSSSSADAAHLGVAVHAHRFVDDTRVIIESAGETQIET